MSKARTCSALSLSVGTVVWFDLRLLGATMRTRPVSEVFESVKGWMFAGFGLMFVTGALLFTAHATKAYDEPVLPGEDRAAAAGGSQRRSSFT